MKKIVKYNFVKYVIVALFTSALNIGVYLGCYKYLISSILISNIAAYSVSIIVQFFLNRHTVFDGNHHHILIQIILFLAVKLIAFFIDSGVLFICLRWFKMNDFIAKLIANCSTTISNYSLNKKIVFK